jgi:hypothetical protein
VDILRSFGDEQEARALERDLDETVAILDSLSTAVLNELREELWAEMRAAAEGSAGAGDGGEAADGGGSRSGGGGSMQKKKLTRKQRKRRAARRRKAGPRSAEAGAGGNDDGDAIEEVTAAAAQLEMDEPESESEPEPEPEECAICLNDLPAAGEEGGEGAVLLVCTHAFHTVCLGRWKDKCMEKGIPFTCCMCRRVVAVAGAGAAAEGGT